MARLFLSLLLASATTFAAAHEAWPGQFTCPATQAKSPTLGPDGLCVCTAGWTGPECGVCTSDAGCAAVVGKGSTCAQTSFAGEKNLVRVV